VLRATTACNFLISHLASWLCTRRFSEPTFRPSGATNHWKNAMFRDFPTFSRTFCDLLSSSLLFSDSSHLCFSSVHIVGSLTSKLPSISAVHVYTFLQRQRVSSDFLPLDFVFFEETIVMLSPHFGSHHQITRSFGRPLDVKIPCRFGRRAVESKGQIAHRP